MEENKNNQDVQSADGSSNNFLNEDLQCRLYRKDFPEENDLVITEIVKVNENGAYVVLLEYESMEGLILSNEVTKKRVKSVKKFMKVGKQETMIVIRVDKEKRYIDLSKKQVKAEEAAEREKYFKKAKMVHNILKEVAVKLKCKVQDLYEQFGWDLYDKFVHAYDAFRKVMSDPEEVFGKIDITAEQKEALTNSIAKKMAPTAVKIRGTFELNCFTSEGIDAIKYALLKAKEAVNDEHFVQSQNMNKIEFKIISPPTYKCELITLEKAKGVSKCEEALKIIEESIKEKGGTFKQSSKIEFIGLNEDQNLDDIENQNQNESESDSESNEEGIDIQLDDEEEEGGGQIKQKKKPKKKADSDEEDEEEEEDDDEDDEEEEEEKKPKKGKAKKGGK